MIFSVGVMKPLPTVHGPWATATKLSCSCGSSWVLTVFIRSSRVCSTLARSVSLRGRLAGLFGEQDNGEGARHAGAHQAAGIHHGVGEQLALDRRGHHVLALAGFELLLDAADDLELAVRLDAGQIAGAEEAVRR